MWKICGQELSRGEKRQMILKPNMEDYEIPVTLVCGKAPGKTVVVTAQIHAGYFIIPGDFRSKKGIRWSLMGWMNCGNLTHKKREFSSPHCEKLIKNINKYSCFLCVYLL